MRPIATTTSDFPDLRRKGCIYVDKTAYFHRLVTDVGTSVFFLARPRRFGKSLMITALKAIFQGHRELFDGLAIAETDWAWETWPVLHYRGRRRRASVALVAKSSSQAPLSRHRLPICIP